ncbi:MAG: ABC transporter permease [Bacillota bacterium]
MTNFPVLFQGELQRMQKYHILSASVVVAFFWIALIYFMEVPDVTYFFTLIVFFDIVSMAIIMIGVSIFFEKQEGVLKSLFVSPINKTEFIGSKTLGNLISNLITILIVYAYALIFREINVDLLGLIGAILLIGIFHSLIGFLIVYRSNDFTEMLIKMMQYLVVLALPVVLEELNVITSAVFTNLLFLLPTKSAAVLIEATTGGVGFTETMIAAGYLLLASAVAAYFVLKKFNEFTIRESGV